MKLEKGMYCRTKKGKIYKFNTDNSMAKNGAKKYMVNCSHNIIDLIEAGDYVNDFKVIGFRNDDGDYYLGIVVPDDDWANILPLSKLTIYSIVTKEMFESMEYKVEE